MDKNYLSTAAEIELLEFKGGDNSYGVDINDIREILPCNYKPTPIPNSHPFLEGIIMPRDFLIPIVDFSASLLLDKAAAGKDNPDTDISELRDIDNSELDGDDILTKTEDMLIVTAINNLNIGFHVDRVSGIHKIDPSLIENPGKKLSTKQKNVIAGIYKTEDRKIEIIDLRKLIKLINPSVNVD
jgi:two-component system chemotaxis response regulator CheV